MSCITMYCSDKYWHMWQLTQEDFLNEFSNYTLLNLDLYYPTYYCREWLLRVLNRVKRAYGKDGIGLYQLFRAALELSPALDSSLLADDLARLGYGSDFLKQSKVYRCSRLVENAVPGTVARLTAYLPDPYTLSKIHTQLLLNVFMAALEKVASPFREKFLLSNNTLVMYLFEPREVEPPVPRDLVQESANFVRRYFNTKSHFFQRRNKHIEYFIQEWFGSALEDVVHYNPGLNSIYIPKLVFVNHIASKKNIRMWHLVTLSLAFFRGIYTKMRDYDLDVIRRFNVAQFRASFKEAMEGLQDNGLPPYLPAAFNPDHVFHDIHGDYMAYVVAEEALREYMKRQLWDDYRLHDLKMTWKEIHRTIFLMHQCEKGPHRRLQDYHWGTHLPAKIRTRILFASNATKAGFGC